jgi:hypothetical protein
MIARRVIAILVDIVLFVLYLLAWTIAIVLIAGFCEIIFHWNAMWGLIPGAILILLISTALYFVWPLIKFKRTAGSGLIAKGKGTKADLRPLALYGKVLAIMLYAYFLTWGISRLVFGAMVKKQEKVVESMGMSLDWKSYYPAMDSLDNAAPYLSQAADSLTNKEASRLLSCINYQPDTIAALSKDIERCLVANRKALVLLDSALARHTLIWHDNKAMTATEAMAAQPFPNYPGIESLLYLCFLDVVYAGYRGDMERCAQGVKWGIGLLTLQRQDPTQVNLIILNMMELRTPTYSLITLTKVAQDKDKLFSIIGETHDRISQIATGLVRENTKAELAYHAALLGEIYNEGPGGPTKSLLQAWSIVILSLYERIWWPWERYYALQCAEYAIRETAPENTFATIDSIHEFNNEVQHLG